VNAAATTKICGSAQGQPQRRVPLKIDVFRDASPYAGTGETQMKMQDKKPLRLREVPRRAKSRGTVQPSRG